MGRFAAVPDEFIDAGDTIVALGKYSGTYKATGKSFKANFAQVWKIRDGKAVGLFSMSSHYWFTELYRQLRNLCNRGEPNETLPPM